MKKFTKAELYAIDLMGQVICTSTESLDKQDDDNNSGFTPPGGGTGSNG